MIMLSLEEECARALLRSAHPRLIDLLNFAVLSTMPSPHSKAFHRLKHSLSIRKFITCILVCSYMRSMRSLSTLCALCL